MIELEHIGKNYGGLVALKDVSINIKKGEVFGLIGPDGAGKTSLFRILATLLKPTQGRGVIDGLDIVSDYRTIRTILGYMPGKFSLYHDLSVEENLNFFASVFGLTIEQSYNLIEPIYKQIEPYKNRRAGKLSGGMKQKLALCCALIHKPKVLLLDEPTTGVDVVSRAEFWDMLDELKKQDISIVVSTPYMDEALRCDRIALINNGEILTTNTPSEIIAGYNNRLYSLKGNSIYSLLKQVRAFRNVISAYSFGDECHVAVDSDFNLDEYLKFMQELGSGDFSFVETKPTIEDVFIDLMQK